ncbi:efflux RND transporter permease subunit [Roseofilum casamattae]|uniref:Efflux RND transporter permease subunit n=1 Tax=Roseofilum casamattae BLCC-M143 TaxID=3022442 RepID=A0ABT7BZW8_9CYAN|nr:efflux RND transporter permease subunit [Roseofilum casamattae]MDJ1184737.1 efflux RND transporter permease subunit [Roseofilum casamattae BLCC-M143]
MIFYRNRQLLVLSLILIVVWGISSFLTLPRMEDPQLTQRFGTVTTFFPGATPQRVESLITEKIEEELVELEEINYLESTSSTGISVIQIELKETINDVKPVWSEVRSKLDDISLELPPGASDPEYEASNPAANALIVGLTWELDDAPNPALLDRLAEGLEDELRQLPGTDKVERFGAPTEEVRVDVNAVDLARLGLTARSLSQQIQASDAKVSAGQFRNQDTELLFEVDSQLDSLERIRQIPIQLGSDGQVAQLGDIARLSKGVDDPPAELALINGHRAIAVAARVESDYRVDLWAQDARALLQDYQNRLSDGIGMVTILDQSEYVQQRLDGVIRNLILGSSLVILVSLIILGWKSALIVGSALPLATLMVFGAMKVMGIPLHQMSITGIIIALGLLIDNAIVVVDEVQVRLQAGREPGAAVQHTVSHLFIPLLASTLTTVLAFFPIAASPGPTGEFIGAIGTTVILAVGSSLFLSLTIIAALVGRLHHWQPLPQWSWLQYGFSDRHLSKLYRNTLNLLFRSPWFTIGLALVLPIVGFSQFHTLEQQFFPPTNRDQFYIEFELPAQTAIAETQRQVLQARELIRSYPQIDEVQWFLGKSAPTFFYNVVFDRENAPYYAQGIVQLNSTEGLRQTIQDLQRDLDGAFPQAQVLVKQLEQGPPFNAPIELRLYGSDLEELRRLGNELRGELNQVEDVIHTSASLTEALPKLALTVDEVRARRVGLDNEAIANQLDGNLQGIVGGSILEGTEDIPIRVRVADATNSQLGRLSALDLVAPETGETIPLDTLATVGFVPDFASISRYNGQRINTVEGFITAGALPSTVLQRLEEHLKTSEFELPPGYSLAYGGEADARGNAIGNLFSTVGVLAVLMAATLVLSFNSFRLAIVIGTVAIAAVGLAAFALWAFDTLFGFTAILGTLGLIGLAINDSIVVLAALREDPKARYGDRQATVAVVFKSTRHVIATTLTTMMGFVPLLLDPTGFWPPLAIAIAGGLGGATLLALYYIPSVHLLLYRSTNRSQARNEVSPDSIASSMSR